MDLQFTGHAGWMIQTTKNYDTVTMQRNITNLKPILMQQNCALDEPDIAKGQSIFHVESVTYLTTN